MRTTGRYTGWFDETFTIQCSYDNLFDLYQGLKIVKMEDELEAAFDKRTVQWLKMLEEVAMEDPDALSFGEDYHCTQEY